MMTRAKPASKLDVGVVALMAGLGLIGERT